MASADLIEQAAAIAPRALGPSAFVRLARIGAWLAAGGALVLMCWDLGVRPDALAQGSERLGRFLVAMWPPTAGGHERQVFEALAETLAMAFAATVMAVAFSLPLALLGARTVVRHWLAHWLIRRTFDVFRGIPALVWALTLITAIGLGPMVGVMAIVFAETPYLAKLFAEMLESRSEQPVESVRAAGAGPIQVLRFGAAPQVTPNIAGFSLYLFEVNVRASAILGIVGAGGIGAILDERIGNLILDQVAYILILYVLLVAAIDFVSQRLRRRLIEGASTPAIGGASHPHSTAKERS